MSTPAAPSTLPVRKKPFEYSQTEGAIRVRNYREAKKAEAALLRSPECMNQTTAPSEVTSAPAPKGAKPRKRQGEYSSNPKAVASRERQRNMTPGSRARSLQNQTSYSRKRAKHAAEDQSGSEELSGDGLSVDEEARVTQKRAAEDTTHPQDERRRSTRKRGPGPNSTEATTATSADESSLERSDSAQPAMETENQQPSADTTTTTSGDQSSLQQSEVTLPTVITENEPHTVEPDLEDKRDDQRRRLSYSDHPILGLEFFVGKLSEEDGRVAKLLFKLVQEDYARSAVFFGELLKLFAPLKERYDREWPVIEEKDLAFTKAESDILEYETLIEYLDGVLDKGAPEDTRAALHLVRRNFKDRHQFEALLSHIFSPLKKRNKDRRAKVTKMRKIFQQVDDATY